MRKRRFMSLCMGIVMLSSMFVGCQKKDSAAQKQG